MRGNVPTLVDLPDEVLATVLGRVSERDVLRCRLVCRRLCRVVDSLPHLFRNKNDGTRTPTGTVKPFMPVPREATVEADRVVGALVEEIGSFGIDRDNEVVVRSVDVEGCFLSVRMAVGRSYVGRGESAKKAVKEILVGRWGVVSTDTERILLENFSVDDSHAEIWDGFLGRHVEYRRLFVRGCVPKNVDVGPVLSAATRRFRRLDIMNACRSSIKTLALSFAVMALVHAALVWSDVLPVQN